MLDKLQVFFEENNVENEVLRSVTLLTEKVEKWEQNLRNKKISLIFSSNFFCSYECKLKQKHWKRKISHLKFVFIFYLQNVSSLSSFFTKIDMRLRYRQISTMIFLSIKKSLLYPQNGYGETTVCYIGFCWDFNRLLVKLCKADTCLWRTHWTGTIGVCYTQVSLYPSSKHCAKHHKFI